MKRNLVDQYVHYAEMQMECTFSGNYKKGNRASEKLFDMNTFLKENFEENREIIDLLIESSNPNVCIWISDVSLDLQYRADKVISILKNISKREDLGLIGLNAEMQLKTRNLL